MSVYTSKNDHKKLTFVSLKQYPALSNPSDQKDTIRERGETEGGRDREEGRKKERKGSGRESRRERERVEGRREGGR